MSDSPTATSVAEPTDQDGAVSRGRPGGPFPADALQTERGRAKPANSTPPRTRVPVAAVDTAPAADVAHEVAAVDTAPAADVERTAADVARRVAGGGLGVADGGLEVADDGQVRGRRGRSFVVLHRVRGFRPGVVSGLVVIALVLAGGCGWFGDQLRQQHRRDADARAATTVAEQVVSALWTVDAGNSKDVFSTLLARSTGSLRTQMSQASGTFQQVLTQQKVSSSGSVVQSGLGSLTGDRATVLVAVNASITSAQGKTELRQYRMKSSVQRTGGRWLVSDLEFVA